MRERAERPMLRLVCFASALARLPASRAAVGHTRLAVNANERQLAAETENVPLKSPEELKGFEFTLLARHRNQWPQGTQLFEGLYHFR